MNNPTFAMFSLSGFGRAVCALLFAFVLVAVPAAMAATPEHAAPGITVADPHHPATTGGHHEEAHHHHELPAHAPVLGHIGPFPINNSMILTWFTAGLVIFFAQMATRRVKEVPDGAQNFWEWIVESLRNFLEGIIGRDLTRKTFWFFASVFIFILASNWFGLLPGVGTVGWGPADANGNLKYIDTPLLRGGNADLNMTLAMAMIFFACWIYWAFKANGPGGFFMHIFGPRGDSRGLMRVLMIIVFFCVGVLEVVSILFRPVSLSFRLYGNVFAGETMLEAMANLYPPLAPIIPIPFYFLELLVGFVQALVFTLLTAVFTLLICEHHEEPAHGEGDAAPAHH